MTVIEFWPAAEQFFITFGLLVYQFLLLIGIVFQNGALLIVWVLWWLLAINWNRLWPVLARGAWAPVVLMALTSALAWSQIAPSNGTLFGLGTFPNFWWQLGDVCLLLGLALFCGWLQGVFGWSPAEISLEPPTSDHGHGHELAHH